MKCCGYFVWHLDLLQKPQSAIMSSKIPNIPPQTPVINDTTLRDGEQTAGVGIQPRREARHCPSPGRAWRAGRLEIGISAMGAVECESIRAVADLGLAARLMVCAACM